ncbi:Gfo/Idh/MocA family protein [Evansella tamaricis]|uniref:Gfo/Idh/MocA family oxidoreductase n=1 Tax=Evansella tamaricis TaxID=2069301 RepID=A0ABS6JI59_9BACI|nr:Gfo/Idh/MocA family oxidoreductase [Evansella tamaricis]MBU9713070.1 Gfo/Idh/MocA family oxidoreductase [Evansella tamaricis]
MNDNKIVKVGVIGVGAIGKGMTEVFNEHRHTKVTAICDVAQDIVEKKAKDLGGIYWTTNYKELLEQDVDLVYVAVPPALHYSIVMDILDSGKHVLCEKPLANSLEEAGEMVKKAEITGLVNAVHYPLSYINNIKALSQRMEEGYLGKVRRVELEMRFPQWPRKWQQNNWIATRKQGGFVFEVAGHFIQLIHQLFGRLTDIESIMELPEDPTACETGIIAQMKLEDGTPVLVNGISQIAGEQEQSISLTIYGTKGTLALVDLDKLYGGKVGEAYKELPVSKDKSFWDEFIQNLVNAINGESAEIIDFYQGYEVQKVLESLRKTNY